MRATALLVAGDLDRAAARAREAINVRTDGRASDHLVSAKAYADLACIELASGHLDAAQHALGPFGRRSAVPALSPDRAPGERC